MTTPYSRKKRQWHHAILLLLSVLTPLLILLAFLWIQSTPPVRQPSAADSVPTSPAATAATEPVQTLPLPTNPAWNPTDSTVPGTSPTEPQPDPLEQHILYYMNAMTLSDKIYQLFIVSPEQLTLAQAVTEAGETMQQALQEKPVGGMIFFKTNLVTRNQTSVMLQNAQSFSRTGLFMAVDEEGGIVSRLGSNPLMGTTRFPNMGTLKSPQEAYNVGQTIGSEIRELGFNLDFAPVADVNSNPNNPVIGQRAFSSDPVSVSEMVASCVRGFRDSGMICTLKHFPGHGDTQTDSHFGSAQSVKSLAQLRECEFLPFQSGIEAGAQMVMIGHISLPAVTGNDLPATLSADIVTGLLRSELGFDGVIVTDSMMMQAVTDHYSSGEAAVLAIEAGVDLILLPQDLQEAHDTLVDAVLQGRISPQRIDDSLLRILRLKQAYGII